MPTRRDRPLSPSREAFRGSRVYFSPPLAVAGGAMTNDDK